MDSLQIGDNPLSEPMIARSGWHIHAVILPQYLRFTILLRRKDILQVPCMAIPSKRKQLWLDPAEVI